MCCDGCICCSYPNGPIQVILLQFLLFCAWVLSLYAMADCKFVYGNNGNVSLPNFIPSNKGFGFFVWQKENGDCAWDIENENTYRKYIDDVLGSDWRVGRAFGVLAGIIGLILWIWSLVFICVAHPKPLRWLMTGLLLMLVIFQGLTFLPLNSGFCDDVNCEFSRGGGLSTAALILYFFCAIIPPFMKDYPGESPYAKDVHAAAAAPVVDEAPVDEEAPVVEEEEEIVVEKGYPAAEEEDAKDEAAAEQDTAAQDKEAQDDQGDQPVEEDKQPRQIATNESIELP